MGTNCTVPNRAYVNLGTAVVSGVWSPTYRYSRAWRTLLAAQGEGYIYESVLRSGSFLVNWFVDQFVPEGRNIAIGSGTITDSAKYATFLGKREYSVFPTSPMNANTTPTASVFVGGFKKSITCHSANGVFFDLSVVSKCPRRLIAAAFADVVCRTTSQVDWLMSQIFFGTDYQETAGQERMSKAIGDTARVTEAIPLNLQAVTVESVCGSVSSSGLTQATTISQ